MAQSAAAKKASNDDAVERISGACRERLNEMLDDLLTYVRVSNVKGSIGLKIEIAPDKDIPDGYTVEIVPSLSVKGLRTSAAAKITRIGSQLQLTLGGLDFE